MLLLALGCGTGSLPPTSTSPEREDVAGCRTEGKAWQGELEMVANGLYNGWAEQSVWDYSWEGGWSHEAFTRDEWGCVNLEERQRFDAGTETLNWFRTSTCNHKGDPIAQVIEEGGSAHEFDIKNEYDGNDRVRAETYRVTGDGEKVLGWWDEWEYNRSGSVERWEVGYGEAGEVAESTTYTYDEGLMSDRFYVGTQGAWIESYTYDDAERLVEIVFDDDADGDADAVETRSYDPGWDWPVRFEVNTAVEAQDRLETRSYHCP